jgi:hypothetical protein
VKTPEWTDREKVVIFGDGSNLTPEEQTLRDAAAEWFAEVLECIEQKEKEN